MDWHNMSYMQVQRELNTDINSGLDKKEAEQRLSGYGKNEITNEERKSLIVRFFMQFSDFMVIVLLIAAAVSFTVSLLSGEADLTDPIIITAIVVLNAVIGVIQESKAEHALSALKKLSAPETLCIRNGKEQKIPSELLVPGDIIKLNYGDVVPADARLISSVNLKCGESSLTGESEPALKNAGLTGGKIAAERKCMVYSSCTVASGHGTAIVTATGMDTEIGKIAGMIGADDNEKTPLQRRLAALSKMLGISALVICGVIFILGLFHNLTPLETFMISVSLAVAAIPEGLPAIVTIVLALKVQKMAEKNAIIRKLPAVETLGSATVICADKTGTLTQNRMSVCSLYDASGECELRSDRAKNILKYATLCCNAQLNGEKGRFIINGEPTETSICEAAANCGIFKSELEKVYPRIDEEPFDSEKKRMITVHRNHNGYLIIIKGAPDVVLPMCKSEDQISKITAQTESMAGSALRVLCVAYKFSNNKNTSSGYTFCGLIGIMDPPRPDVKAAVATCKRAGIRTIMITGDHAITALSIAKNIGIARNTDTVYTGEQLNKMSDSEFSKCVKHCNVYARVTPEHKMRIVKALQKCGEVVAMTGDGVNDAPALSAADIGCAMGKHGTDVAKSAADMVLCDDNFSTIVEAVRDGRGIFDNIKKAVHFLLSCNIGEILTILAASIFNIPVPLAAIQLLWVNLVTDSLPAISLGLEQPEPDIMKRKPIKKNKSFLSPSEFMDILLEGCMIGAVTLLGFVIGNSIMNDIITGRTRAFCILSISQLVHAFNVRSSLSVLQNSVYSNKVLCISFLLGIAMQTAVTSVPLLCGIFKTTPLNVTQWLIVAVFSLIPLFVCETVKFFSNRGKIY